ncbi:MAG: hypothetical protein ACKO3N_00745 [Verrucomicrobiota bacterium]
MEAYLADGRHWLPSLADHGTPGWPDPFRAVLTPAPDGLVLEWPVVAGETYRVEVADRLTPPAWVSWEEGSAPQDGIRRGFLPSSPGGDPAADAARFYRVLWLR